MCPGWEHVAAPYGGTVAGLQVADGLVVFAATSVGVYRSTDGAATWSLPGTAPTVPFASAVVSSPQFATDHTVFACGADGLYRSRDAAESWQRVLIGGRMFSVVVGGDGVTVLVATEDDGILRSEDSGASWTGANAGLLDLTVLSLALSPSFETDHTAFAGTASGLYRTRNGGRSWRAVDLGVEDPAVQCIGVSPDFTDDRLVLVGTEANGLLRSRDGGSTWQAVGFDGVSAIAFHDGFHVAAATEGGVAISTDAGDTWRVVEDGPREAALCLVFQGDDLLVGLHMDGVMRGTPWRPTNNGLSARLDTSLVISMDSRMFIGGLEDGVRVSADGGFTSVEYNAGLNELALHGLASSATAVWAATPSGVYASGASGWTRRLGEGPALMVAASSRVVAAALGGGRLARSDDEGVTWQPVVTPWQADEIVALTVAPDETIFVVTRGAHGVTLWRSVKGSGTFARWLVDSTPNVSRVALAAVNAANVIVGLGSKVLSPLRNAQEVRGRERRPLWRSSDLSPEVAGITSLTLAETSIFAATNAGVFVSRNSGATFHPWSEGLDHPRMVALAVSPEFQRDRLIYGVGLGGTLWRRLD